MGQAKVDEVLVLHWLFLSFEPHKAHEIGLHGAINCAECIDEKNAVIYHCDT